MPAPKKNADPHPNPSLGLRERKKQDKLERIKDAAIALFAENGFEGATVRQISARAGVSFGTVFRYARDKRDLLFLVNNDDFDRLSRAAFEHIPPDGPLIDQLISIFRHFYVFYSERPALARDLLRELNFYEEGSQAERFTKGIRLIERQLVAFIEQARRSERILSDDDPRVIARLLFGAYRAEVRRWVARGNFDVEAGLGRLRPYLGIIIAGLNPGETALQEKS